MAQVVPVDVGHGGHDARRHSAVALPAGRQRLDRDRVVLARLEGAVLAGTALAALLPRAT